MKKKSKRVVAFLLSFLMVVSMLPTTGLTVEAAAKPKLAKKAVSTVIGGTSKIKVKNAPKGAKITYKSAKKSIATVSKNGKIKGIKSGSTKITVSVNKNAKTTKLTYKVTVKKPKLSKNKLSLEVGKTYKLSVKNKPKKAKYTWVSGNSQIATISKKGKVTAMAEGNTAVKVKVLTAKKAYNLSCQVGAKPVADTTDVVEQTYVITFDSNGGSVVESQTVKKGALAIKPIDPTHNGYIFDGWYTAASDGMKFDFNTPITANIILYAHWIEKPAEETQTYTVTFDSNGGSTVASQTVKKGDFAKQPTDPTHNGYTFDGWYTAASGGTKFDFNTAITANITLYAHWNSVGGNGSGGGGSSSGSVGNGSSSSGSVGNGSSSGGSVGNGSSSGGSVGNGNSSSGGNNSGNGSTIPQVIYYKVTFVSVGVSDAENMPSVQTVKSGECAIVPSTPTRIGYTFDGWYINEELTHEYDFKTPVTTNIILYAKWVPVNSSPIEPDTQCKVTFVLNDGSDGIYEIQTVNVNGTVHEPSAPVREQYRFTGWYTEAETAAEYNFNTPVTGDFILYAGWGNPNGNNKGIYGVSSGGGTETSISGIERSTDGFIYVTLNASTPSTVVVEFLDEDKFWEAPKGTENNLTAINGIAAQTPNYCEMESVSIPLRDVSDSLPEHYVLRARLYGQTGEELCDPYYSIQYTSIYENFDKLTLQDRIKEYGTDRVIAFDTEESNSNYGVFANDVKIIKTENSTNILTVAYEFQEDSMFPTTTYTFANPSKDVSELKVGDKLYALDKDGYPQLFKVGNIKKTSESMVVITPNADVVLSDFYMVLKMDMDGTKTDVQVQDGIQPQLEIIDVNKTFSKAINHSIDWKPLENADWLKFTGSVGGKATLSIKLVWDAKLFKKDYFEASASVKVEATLKASINATGGPSWDVTDKVNAEWRAGKVSVPTNVPGLTLILETSVPVDLKFSGTGTLSATATLQGGFSFNTTSGFHPTGKAELKSEVNFTAQAELKAGPKVAVGFAFLEKIVKADASVQAGVKATVSGSVGAQITTGDSKHGCPLCLKGDIKWFKNAKTSLSYYITEKVSAKHEKTIYEAETALGIGKVYLSLIHGGAESVFVDKNGNPKTGPVFGWGDCPNQVWRTIFKAKDSGENDIAIALNVNRQDGRIRKSGTTSFNEFLNNGVYTASGEIDGLTIRKSFTVNGAKQTVVLTPTSTDRSLSGIITDSDTSSAIEKVDVIAKQNDMIVAGTKSSSDGTYTLNLPEGSYMLEVSKTGYVTNTIHVTILNDRETYQNVELTCGETGKGGFSGRIVDASSSEPIEGVQLEVRSGWNASSASEVVITLKTNANGEYKYEKPKLFGHVVGLATGGYTVTASKEGYNTKSFNIMVLPDVQNNPQPEEPLSRHIQVESGSYRIVLTWGANPRDLDSHIVGQLNSGNNFHVYFSHKNQMDGSNMVCNLDRDDTRGNGTETIILNPQNDHPYYYYIYKYAGSSDIAHSGAHIDIYDSTGLIDSFNAPTDQGSGRYWNVFAIVDGQMIIQNTITDSANVSYAGVSNASAFGLDELEQSNLINEDNSPKNIENSEIGESSN